MTDARFQDGGEAPLRLVAQDAEDLKVISTLIQDAVLPVTELKYDPKRHRFALLLNRFRWEDRVEAERVGRAYERVRSVLVVEDVRKVQSMGFDRSDADLVLSVLAIEFTPGEDGTGRLTLTLAGDGAVALDVEALEVRLDDVTRPYRAPSGKVPSHE
ncbi:DUF2948 family protein [Tabrizicola aquatica]|uniref:DUF2948 family protein n=1 Tax=Tabrizicola aquatica TaxID=909926 RepID=UPI000CD293B1|nr:DUF2948 family protein [Tabrizicola aquatica]